MNKTIVIANDHAGVELKNTLSSVLSDMGYHVENLGTDTIDSVDYPDYGNKLAEWMKDKPDAMGILICGSGIGISISANRHAHIRAALCSDGLAASLARRHNNANVLCLGARLIGIEQAIDCVKQFLSTAFEGGRHERRVNKL